MFIPDYEIKYGEPDPAKMCGDGTIEEFERAPASPYLRALYVKFVNGAHTKWHYHTGEQMLLATQGKGFVEFQGLQTLEIREGDRVFIPTSLWHRHGADEGETLVHLAVTTGETIWDKADPCQKHAHGENRLVMSVETEIADLNRRILQAEEAGRVEDLAPLLAEGFTIVRSTGQTADRQAFLDGVPGSANRGRSAAQPRVHRIGECIVFTCIVTTTRDPDGTPNHGRFWNTRLFIRQNGQWRCAAWQVMKICDD